AAPDHPDVFRGRPDDLAVPDRRYHLGQGSHRPTDGAAGPPQYDADGCAVLSLRYRAARPPLDHVRKQAGGELMLHPTPILKESPSQTAGPYVHIGMTPNFCDITGVCDVDLG